MLKKILPFSFTFLVSISSAHAQFNMIESDLDFGSEIQPSYGYDSAYDTSSTLQLTRTLPGGEYFCDINSNGELRLYTHQYFPDGTFIRVEVENGVLACNVESSIPLSRLLPPIIIQGNAQCTTQEISLNISAGFAEGCQGSGCVIGNGIRVQCTANINHGFDCSITASANGHQLGVISISGDPRAAAQTVIVKCGDLANSVIETTQEIIRNTEIVPLTIDTSIPPYTPEASSGIGFGISFPF